MNRFFYSRLALTNLKKNTGLYIPYMLTAIGMICVFYAMNTIASDDGISEMVGAGDLQLMLSLGSIVIGIFASIFLFYTNSFLIKRRKKEFGLFNVLGMEKRHIGRMMFAETLFVAVICLVLGFLSGIILYKLIFLLLLRITNLKVPFGFQISINSLVTGLILFAGIFALTLLYNLAQVGLSKPIELIKSKNQGEREPKTKWLLTIIGVLALGGGYYIALTAKNPIAALVLFFVAVILVMVGTYALFVAGSIALLKVLKKNTKYFYKTKHFIAVSGMIYRMKQNAVGLANICILSTMVLVMITGTVSLFAGTRDILNATCPEDMNFTFMGATKESQKEVDQIIKSSIKDQGLHTKVWKEYRYLDLLAGKEGGQINLNGSAAEQVREIAEFCFITMDQYQSLTGKTESLKENEILVYSTKGNKEEDAYQFGGKEYKIKDYIEKIEIGANTLLPSMDSYCVVVKNEDVLSRISMLQEEANMEERSEIVHEVQLSTDGSVQKKRELINLVADKFSARDDSQSFFVEERSEKQERMDIVFGGFLFLGLFLGFVFLMATVLIIYYKQVSEGYEDKLKFEIMKKVGLSKKEVRASIRSQIIIVFFMPLLMAVVHLLAALPMIIRMIAMFNMYNVTLIIICTLLTILIFIIMYLLVYAMTAKVYGKIVSG